MNKKTNKLYTMEQNIDTNPNLILDVIKNLQNYQNLEMKLESIKKFKILNFINLI